MSSSTQSVIKRKVNMGLFDKKLFQFGAKRMHYFWSSSAERQVVLRVGDGYKLGLEYLPLKVGVCFELKEGNMIRAWENDHTKHIEIPGIEGSVLVISNRSYHPVTIDLDDVEDEKGIGKWLDNLAAVESDKALARLNESNNKQGNNAKVINVVLIVLGMITAINLIVTFFAHRGG